MVVAAAALVVACLAFVALTARWFVFPATDTPRAAGAIVVLGGAGPRISKGIALARAGYAPLLAISLAYPPSAAACQRDYAPSPRVRVICFRPAPFTTQGEARFIARLAAGDHLRSILVVSGTSQTTRARIRISRCYSGTVLVDPVEPGGFWAVAYSVVYEWGALLKAETLQRSC